MLRFEFIRMTTVRLWSIHPKYLDRAGLVALWREALLAQAVLSGKTRGYTHHPQLERFRAQPDPLAAIGIYLWGVWEEATRRGYSFNGAKIDYPVARECSATSGAGTAAFADENSTVQISVTTGQLEFEESHLRMKIAKRAPGWEKNLQGSPLQPHPLFTVKAGPIANWEKGSHQAGSASIAS